jgi:hypothetical protein
MSKGVIAVDGDLIKVMYDGTTARLSVSIENLREAARLLAGFMDIPSEDYEAECRRVHARDQRDALIRDSVAEANKRHGQG